MSYGKVKTIPDFAKESSVHQQAIADGFDHFFKYQRNVVDHFKDLSDDEIKQYLKATAFPYAVLFESWLGDFNTSTGIRNANAFNAEAVYYVGNRKLDRRGAVGTYKYTEVNFLPTLDDVVGLKKQYTFIGVDNVPGSVSIDNFEYPERPLFVFGEEGTGLTPQMMSMCEKIVYIPQFGSVRSINCGCASAIVMNDFVTKWRRKNAL